jgi:hypothetical protein
LETLVITPVLSHSACEGHEEGRRRKRRGGGKVRIRGFEKK